MTDWKSCNSRLHCCTLRAFYPKVNTALRVMVAAPDCGAVDEPEEASEEDIIAAEHEVLKAKSLYHSRGNVIQSVLIAHPIVRAIHAGDQATSIEQ